MEPRDAPHRLQPQAQALSRVHGDAARLPAEQPGQIFRLQPLPPVPYREHRPAPALGQPRPQRAPVPRRLHGVGDQAEHQPPQQGLVPHGEEGDELRLIGKTVPRHGAHALHLPEQLPAEPRHVQRSGPIEVLVPGVGELQVVGQPQQAVKSLIGSRQIFFSFLLVALSAGGFQPLEGGRQTGRLLPQPQGQLFQPRSGDRLMLRMQHGQEPPPPHVLDAHAEAPCAHAPGAHDGEFCVCRNRELFRRAVPLPQAREHPPRRRVPIPYRPLLQQQHRLRKAVEKLCRVQFHG